MIRLWKDLWKLLIMENIDCLFYLSVIVIFPPQNNCINIYSFKLFMNVLIQSLCHAHYGSLVRHGISSVVFIWLQGYITEHTTVAENFLFIFTTCRMFSLTPLSRALLEKLINNTQPVISLFVIRRFIAMFTRAYHWVLSWARWIQSTYSHSISVTSTLVLSF
jgi:hypothetical protein